MSQGEKELAVRFPAGGVRLEGRLAVGEAGKAAVVCHPHPEYGGTMDNNVVLAVAGALLAAGHGVLRFNFRGVGASEGAHGGGDAEMEDVRGAVDFLCRRLDPREVIVAGYSFGAVVGLRAGRAMPAVSALIAVAPPVSSFDLGPTGPCAKPKLVIAGDRDPFCDREVLERWLADLGGTAKLVTVPAADHFFFGHEKTIARAVRNWVASLPSAGGA